MKSRLSVPRSVAQTQTKAAAAEHIAVESSRLVRLANEHGFGLLAHLIDMVVLEAWREATESESASPDHTLLPEDNS